MCATEDILNCTCIALLQHISMTQNMLIDCVKRYRLWAAVAVAFWLRWQLMSWPLSQLVAQRLQAATPLNSWRRVKEAVYLAELNVSAYDGDRFHELPYYLSLYQQLLKLLNENQLRIGYILVDMLTCWLLYTTGQRYVVRTFTRQRNTLSSSETKFTEETSAEKESGAEGDENVDAGHTTVSCARVILRNRDLKLNANFSALAYLFNPFVLISCAAQTTAVTSNLLHALLLYLLEIRRYWLCVTTAGLLAASQFYPVTCWAPVIALFGHDERKNRWSWKAAFITTIHLIFITSVITFGARVLCKDWMFMHNVYTFAFVVEDLKPNIGLFWYFFTEMFEHFYNLFIAAFQINALCLYMVPVGIRFRKDPVFMCLILIMLNSVFRSYPSPGEIGLYIGAMPIWLNLLALLQQTFLVSLVLCIGLVLLPIVWYLWIVLGTANANFLFGVTLCIAAAQIFLITDFCFAWVKQEFWLNNHGRVIKRVPAFSLMKLLLEN